MHQVTTEDGLKGLNLNLVLNAQNGLFHAAMMLCRDAVTPAIASDLQQLWITLYR
jgi:hypothetical protein